MSLQRHSQGSRRDQPALETTALARAWDADQVDVTDEEFEDLVTRALDGVPDELARLAENVVVLVEPEPAYDDPELLGLYEGIPLTERDSTYTFAAPDRILIFRGPLLRMCGSPEELVEEVRITVVHEIAHHFGIDDDHLHELGYA